MHIWIMVCIFLTGYIILYYKLPFQAIDEDVDDDEPDEQEDSPPAAKRRKRGGAASATPLGRAAGLEATPGMSASNRGRGSRIGGRGGSSRKLGGTSPTQDDADSPDRSSTPTRGSLSAKRGRRAHVAGGPSSRNANVSRFQGMLLKLIECVTDYRDRLVVKYCICVYIYV